MNFASNEMELNEAVYQIDNTEARAIRCVNSQTTKQNPYYSSRYQIVYLHRVRFVTFRAKGDAAQCAIIAIH